jgi:CRP-like cAMP-binding protein
MNEKKDLEKKLRTFPCFSALDETARADFLQYGTRMPLKKGRTLFYQGDKAESVSLVLSGEMKKIKTRADGTSLILGIVQEGGWLGLPEMLAEGLYLTDCVAEDGSEVLSLFRNQFNRFLRIPKFQDAVNKIIARDFYALHSYIDVTSPLRKITDFFRAKIETFREKDPVSKDWVINMTQDELAEIVGFTRETVNKHLKILESKGIIRIGRAQIMIMDLDQLIQLKD